MSRIDEIAKHLCEAERDRLTMAEIGIDEAMTILERHGIPERDESMAALLSLSSEIHHAMTIADDFEARRARLIRIRARLTESFPLTDADLGVS